jgi:hypothetical protein
LFIAAILFFDWRWALIPFGVRLIIQAIVWNKAMKKLGEQDLFPFFIFWDIWMFFYYLIFAPAIWKKPAKKWN